MQQAYDQEYSRGVRTVLLVTLALNLAVVAAKLVAGIMSRSLSITGDALHSSTDSLNNLAALFILRVASAAPDEEHHYGHSKFESLGAFVIAGFLAITGFELTVSAVKRILGWIPGHVEVTSTTIVIMSMTLGVNLFVWFYESRRARELGSNILAADSRHTLSDVFVTTAILLGILLIRIAGVNLDAYLALVVAGVIALASYQIFSSTVPVLVDRAPFPRGFIAEIVRSTPGVRSVHDIMSRGLPGKAYITMHLVVTPTTTHDAHAITEDVECRLAEKLGRCHVTIHIEPEEDLWTSETRTRA